MSLFDILTTKIPLGNWVENLVDLIINNFSGPLDVFSNIIEGMISGIEVLLTTQESFLLIVIFGLLTWFVKEDITETIFSVVVLGLFVGISSLLYTYIIPSMVPILLGVVVVGLGFVSWLWKRDTDLTSLVVFGTGLLGSLPYLVEVVPFGLAPFLVTAILGLISWIVKEDSGLTAFVVLGLMLVLNLRMWAPLITTMSSILTSVFVCLVVGIPIGVLKAHSKILDIITRPMLDFMQTIPPFVYLIPALMFFGLGNVSGVIATVVFAIAPPIRLTYLGIKQVSDELKEAGRAFGCTPLEMLYKVELPLALPSIMMGINQCIMLSLSMVVIAAMIGAGGLGKPVLRSLSTVDIGLGFEAGLGVVILAMVLDRLFGRD
ncbi:hypothetical protein JCM15060_24170 [Halanaerobaculum tunisiense]